MNKNNAKRKQTVKGKSKQYIRTVLYIENGFGDVRIGNHTYKVKQYNDHWKIIKRVS